MKKRPQNPYKGHPLLGSRRTKEPAVEDHVRIIEALLEFHGIPYVRGEGVDYPKLIELLLLVGGHVVPALQLRKPGRRPPERSIHDIAMVAFALKFERSLGNLSNDNAAIKRMAADPFWRSALALGRSEKTAKEKLRYLITDRLRQPRIQEELVRYLRDLREMDRLRLAHARGTMPEPSPEDLAIAARIIQANSAS